MSRLVLATSMAIYAVLVLWLIRGTTLFIDGVNLFINNRGLDAGALFAPLNGHLVLMERSVYAAGFALFGAGTIAFRLVAVFGVLLAVAVLFELLRRRVGNVAALAGSVLVLFLGTAWEVTVVPDVLTNTYSAAAGLGAFLALDRRDGRGDVAAGLLLLASIACWSLGLAFAVGAAARIALEGGARRRLLAPAVPVALYVIWFAWVRIFYVPVHGDDQTLAAWHILVVPNWIAGEIASAIVGIGGLGWTFESGDSLSVFGVNTSFGYLLAPAVVVALAYVVRRRGTSPAFWGATAAFLTFCVSLALAFGHGRTPATARYVYPGAVLGLVVAAEAFRRVRLSRAALATVLGITTIALGANVYWLSQGTSFFRNYAADQRAQWTAIEIAGSRVDPNFRTHNFLSEVKAGEYLAAVARNGSPAYTPTEVASQSEGTRETVDASLVSALRIHLTSAPATSRLARCRVIRPDSTGAASFATSAPSDLVLRSRRGAEISLRRFASAGVAAVGTLDARRPMSLRLPPDGYDGPWFVSAGEANAPVSVCGGG